MQETLPLHSLATQEAVFAWIFIIIGILAIGFALFFFLIIKYSFFKGMAVVLLLTGLLQVVYGSITLNNSGESHLPETSREPVNEIMMLHLKKKQTEAGNFTQLSLSLLLVGIILLIVFRRSAQRYWKGIGLGLLIQGALSAGLLAIEEHELTNYHANVTQQAACHTK